MTERTSSHLEALEDRVERHEATLLNEMERERTDKQQLANEFTTRITHQEALVKEERRRRVELHEEIQHLRKSLQRHNEDELELHRTLRDIDLEEKAEELAFNHLALRHIEEQRMMTDTAMMKQEMHIDAISSLLYERDNEEVDSMRRHLNNTMIGGEVSELRDDVEPDDVLREYSIESGGDSNSSSARRLIDEVLSKRHEVRARQHDKADERLLELNTQRRSIIARREELARRKAEGKVIRARGAEFLTEVELGNAPPLDLIIRNFKNNEQMSVAEHLSSSTKDIQKESIEGTLKQTKEEMPIFIDNLSRLRASNDRDKRLMERHEYRGEMGIHTYGPGEIMAYHLCMDVIWDLAETMMDEYIKGLPGEYAISNEKALWEERGYKLHKFLRTQQYFEHAERVYSEIQNSVVETFIIELHKELQGIREISYKLSKGLMLDVVGEIGRTKFGQEMEHKFHVDVLINSLDEMQENRQRHINIHEHTQPLKLPPISMGISQRVTTDEQAHDDVDIDDHDIVKLEVSTLLSVARMRTTDCTISFNNFCKKEAIYWSHMDCKRCSYELHKSMQGITLCIPSPSGNALAFATREGDIFIWSMLSERPSTIRTFVSSRTERGPVKELSWSLDGTRLIVIDHQQRLRLWDLLQMEKGSENENEGSDKTTGALDELSVPRTLALMDNGDFRFVSGPFLSFETNDTEMSWAAPASVQFYPSMSLLGGQESFIVGLTTGDVIKCNMTGSGFAVSVPLVPPKHGEYSEIAHNIQAELFKGHKYKVVNVAFQENGTRMVTVDERLGIYVWDYHVSALSGFGWFIPRKKMKIDTTDTTFEARGEEVVHFSDVKRGLKNKHTRTKLETSKMREAAVANINLLNLPPPWHIETIAATAMPNKYVHIHAPYFVPSTGATFNLCTYHESGELSSYETQLWVPTKLRCSRVIEQRCIPSGDTLVVMLLYPASAPKGPYVSFITVNLKPNLHAEEVQPESDATVKKGRRDADTIKPVHVTLHPIRIDVPITEADFSQALNALPDERTDVNFTFELSTVIEPLGSDYIYAIISNKLRVFSLTTGREIIDAYQVSEKAPTMPPTARLSVMPRQAGIILYSPKTTSIAFLRLVDGNSSQMRRHVSHTLKESERTRHGTYERRVNSIQIWTLDGSKLRNIKEWCHALVMDCVSVALSIEDYPARQDTGLHRTKYDEDDNGSPQKMDETLAQKRSRVTKSKRKSQDGTTESLSETEEPIKETKSSHSRKPRRSKLRKKTSTKRSHP